MDNSRPSSVDRGVRRIANRLGFAALWGWILLSLALFPTWFGYPWLGVLLALVGLVLCWQAWRASSYPVYAVGTRRDVTTEPITEPGLDCVECGRPAGSDGVRRRYAERRVLFGATIAVPVWGTNVYCAKCAARLEAEPTVNGSDAAAWERERERDRSDPQ